jgi:hypothetical protein
MGRAQGKAKDVFSGVFGERRGLKAEQEALSTAPPGIRVPKQRAASAKKPFSQHERVSRRLMTLAQYLLGVNGGVGVTRLKAQIVNRQMSRLYAIDDPMCRRDLEALRAQGICTRVGGPKPTQGRVFQYQIVPFSSWPKGHQDRYLEWDAAESMR